MLAAPWRRVRRRAASSRSEYCSRRHPDAVPDPSLAALGLNILVGYCGQISLGTGAFMAVGAYAAYNLLLRVPRHAAAAALRCSAALVRPPWSACCSACPSLRIKGLYLAVATLAAQFFPTGCS